MGFVRSITDQIRYPYTLAVSPAHEKLFVADCKRCAYEKPGDRMNSISEYPAGAAKATRVLPLDQKNSRALAVDSSGRLYVANLTFDFHGFVKGSIGSYPPGATQPSRYITDGIDEPVALAMDPLDNLYVANQSRKTFGSLTVYSLGGATLLRTITRGIKEPTALVIGSP